MVLIRQNNENILIAVADNILYCNVDKEYDECIKISNPVLPENLTKGQKDILTRETLSVTSLEFSQCNEYIAVARENKQIIVYNRNFEIVKNFIANRCASKVCFTPSNDLVLSDRTGDVYLYKLDSDKTLPILLLGHLSVILDLIVSECGKFIITCDRDEKIRVSSFPNAYNIVSYCLGHKEFVVSLKMVKNILISASGDGTIRFWDYQQGEEKGQINTNEYIHDCKLLECFSNDMDSEKVDVLALPITDMQVYDSDNLFIAVSIHKCSWLQLYATDLKSCKSIYLRKFDVNSNYPISLWFSFNKYLLILSDKLSCFKLINENYQMCDSVYFNKLYSKYENIFKVIKSNEVTILYKRKYDNVQEYMERKRQRLHPK